METFMKKIVYLALALACALSTLPIVTSADADSKQCRYTSGDKAKGYRC
jgi:hypothetical protein